MPTSGIWRAQPAARASRPQPQALSEILSKTLSEVEGCEVEGRF